VEHLKGASVRKALALLANIILGWKGVPVKNTLAIYEHMMCYVIGPRGGLCYKTFYTGKLLIFIIS
jgi:hypothetical protein